MTTALRACYDRHFQLGKGFYREPSRAVGWETCVWLWDFLERERPLSILDMGAGLSTSVIRLWRSMQFPSMLTWTTDHHPKWLRAAEIELIRDGLPHDHLYLQEHLEHDEAIGLVPAFDVIFYDLNGFAGRLERVPLVDLWLAPRGTLILDDWHNPSYRGAMTAKLRARGFTVQQQGATLDAFGRFVAVATRNEVPDGTD